MIISLRSEIFSKEENEKGERLIILGGATVSKEDVANFVRK